MSCESVETIVGSIGKKVGLCRKEAGLTLNQLAQKSGVSPAAIHKIEKKDMIPSVTVLMKIARALNKGVGYFTQDENGFFDFKERVELARKGQRRVLTSPSGSKMEALAMFLDEGQMEVCIFTFPPGASSGPRSEVHAGEEFFLVLEGEASIFIEDESYLLREGDSIHFKSEGLHRWDNTGGSDLKILWAMTPLPVSSLERWIP